MDTTLCALAGVDPHDERAAAAGLPPVDGLNQWDYLSGQRQESPRTRAHLSRQAYLSGRFKLLTGNVDFACWGGPTYPNASAAVSPKFGPFGSPCNSTLECGTVGCLFDVEADPEERTDLSAEPAYAATLKAMQSELAAANKKVFSPERGSFSPLACEAAARAGGYWAPFIKTDDAFGQLATQLEAAVAKAERAAAAATEAATAAAQAAEHAAGLAARLRGHDEAPPPPVHVGGFSLDAVSELRVNANLTRSALRIGASGGSPIPWLLDEYGVVHHGELFAHMPWLQASALSSSLNGSVGPAVRAYGDICAGDFEYFGATSSKGVEWQQLGVRIKGAFPSPTQVKAGEQDVAADDGTGSAHVNLYPDARCIGCDWAAKRGAVEINAFGRTGNFISFGGRGGSGDVEEWARLDRAPPSAGATEGGVRLAVAGAVAAAGVELQAPDGGRWAVSVASDGQLHTSKLPRPSQNAKTDDASGSTTPVDSNPAGIDSAVNFGFGMPVKIALEETHVWSYNVTTDGGRGVVTHFLATGGDYICAGLAGGQCPPPLNGSSNWNGYIDHAVFRMYIDGEPEASLQFIPALACGVGPFTSRTVSSFFPVAGGVESADGYVGRPNTRAPWSAKYFGKGSADGAWWFSFRIPFARSLRVTAALPPLPGHPEVTALQGYVQVRGAENLPISVGGMLLPWTARLRLQKIEGRPFRWLDRVPLLDVPDGRGAILSNTYAVEVESEGFMEGCVHIYTPRNTTEFPGIVLAYGLEDYYKSAYYFSSGQFTQPETGQTWWTGGWNASSLGLWSAYRVHDSDPQVFRDGVRLMTRIGETTTKLPDGSDYKCLDDSEVGPGERKYGNATVWSYTFYYTW